MDDKYTDQKNNFIEDKLYQDAIKLLSNGHRMTYVFKYVREKAVDDEMRGRVMERVTSDNQVQKINDTRLEQATSPRKIPSIQIIIGLVIIVLCLVFMKYLFQMGWISTIPLIIIFSVLAAWGNRR